MKKIILFILTLSFSYGFDIVQVLDGLGIKYQVYSSKVVSISDGDTIKVSLGGKSVALRLIGADTPEVGGSKLPKDAQKCSVSNEYMKRIGKYSSDYTKNNIKIGDTITYIVFGIDKYQRPVSYLLNHHSIKLIANGYAIAYDSPQLPSFVNNIFSAIEWYARFTQKGLWKEHSKIMTCIKK